jgi:hypothetical protein
MKNWLPIFALRLPEGLPLRGDRNEAKAVILRLIRQAERPVSPSIAAPAIQALIAKWRKIAKNVSQMIPVSVEIQSLGKACAEHADELEAAALAPSAAVKEEK